MTIPDPADHRSLLLHGISELVTNDPAAGPGLLGIVSHAAVIIQDRRIAWVGPANQAPAADAATDVQGRAVLPGWVDSHTRLISGLPRTVELTDPSGAPAPGAGIGATVEATRAAGDDELLAMASRHRRDMLAGGTTYAETTTGYGLTMRDEARLAAIAERAGFDEITFGGASPIPAEYEKDPDGYLDLVCGPMLDLTAPLVGWLEVSCDDGLDTAQVRRVLAAGQRNGLGLRMYGNESGPGPAVLIAVDTGATAVIQCGHLTDSDITSLARSTTVAVLLPAADLAADLPPAPGRDLLGVGVSVALASGAGPHGSPTTSMNLVVGLGVSHAGLTAAQAVHAATAGGARALRRDDVGVITVGSRADLHVLDGDSHTDLVTHPGIPLTHSVYLQGALVEPEGRSAPATG